MSSFNVGLGSWKKGGRVADSSMLTRNVRLLATESGIGTELSVLQSGNLGVPSYYKIPSAETIQTVYKVIIKYPLLKQFRPYTITQLLQF